MILCIFHQFKEMSPNLSSMDRDNIALAQNHEEEESNRDSGFCSGGNFRHISTSECYYEYETLQKNKQELIKSNFYYPELDSGSARSLLKNNSVGNFLVRDSSDSNYLFSVSVKTLQGATSVRILYQGGLFLFDCDERIRNRMPRFESVMSLIDHHVHLTRVGANKSWRWEDSSGKKRVPVELKKPVMKSVPSLSHLCTVKINQSLQHPQNPRSLDLLLPHINNSVKQCLQNYRFRV